MSEIAHLKDTRQYWVATWKVISARPLTEKKPLDEVDEIVYLAIRDQNLDDLGKIVRDFSSYVGADALSAAHTLLYEETEIDLHPDERD